MSDDLVARLRRAGCVYAEDEARILRAAATTSDELARLAARRIAGFPLEQVVGWAEFCGLPVTVAPGVFVPRRRTEFLVSVAAARTDPGAVVVDLCCGTGALGLALATARPGIELCASDVDPAAVACAGANLGDLGAVYHGDLFDALPEHLRGRVDVLLANVPYVPTGAIATLPAEAREHEPLLSLDGGRDGLDVARRMLAGAPGWLSPHGCVLFEVGEGQVGAAVAAVGSAGLVAQVDTDDDRGATVIVAVPGTHRPR